MNCRIEHGDNRWPVDSLKPGMIIMPVEGDWYNYFPGDGSYKKPMLVGMGRQGFCGEKGNMLTRDGIILTRLDDGDQRCLTASGRFAAYRPAEDVQLIPIPYPEGTYKNASTNT